MSDFNESIQVEELENTEIPEEVRKEASQGAALLDAVEDANIEELAKQSVEDNNLGECDNSKRNRTTMISATSKISAELSGCWYSFSFTETRSIADDSNMELERQKLWDTVKVEVDKQCQDVIDMIKNPGQPA